MSDITTGRDDDIIYPSAIAFLLVHAACLTALLTGITWRAAILGFALYWLRIFAIGAGLSVVVGRQTPPASPLFRHRTGCPFTARAGNLPRACGRDLPRAEQRD